MSNEKLIKKIARLEKDIIRYKEALKKDLESDNVKDIVGSIQGYSQEILTLARLIEELKELL